jgi:hypothetical protein
MREVKQRIELLTFIMNIPNVMYKDVARYISAYYKNPDKIMEEVRLKMGIRST